MKLKKNNLHKHKSDEDEFDIKFGFILKHDIDSIANYNAVKTYYFHSRKSCHKNTS